MWDPAQARASTSMIHEIPLKTRLVSRDVQLKNRAFQVAQLTKVIFHLNTRNDEADQHLAAVSQAFFLDL